MSIIKRLLYSDIFIYLFIKAFLIVVLLLLIPLLIYNSVTEPHRRGLHRRAPCSHVHLAYSLRQLRVGISPSLRPQPLQSIAQRLIDSSNIYILQPLPPPHNITLRLFITNTQPTTNSISLQYCRRCQKQCIYKLPYFILLRNL